MKINNAMGIDNKVGSVPCEGKDAEMEENCSVESFLPKNDFEHITVVKTRKPLSSNGCDKQLFLQKVTALETKIPKYVVDFDEKYLLRCLEWMHVSAYISTTSNSSANIGTIPASFNSRGSALDMASLAVESPFLDVGHAVNVKDIAAVTTIGGSILGTVTSSESMVNILRSPLLHKFGALDADANAVRRSVFDSKSVVASNVPNSPVKYVTSSPKKMNAMVKPNEIVHRDDGYDSERTMKRHAYSSSTSSSSSGMSSSGASVVISQGMLKCTWKNGLPTYLFSVDDLGEVYVANLVRHRSPDDKFVDYVYNFHSKPRRKRENELGEVELNFVGKMEVSSSVTLCPQNAEILETRFVLLGSGENGREELQFSSNNHRKNKGLKKKVANVIRTGHMRKKRTPSMRSATSIILEDTSWEPSEEVHESPDNGKTNKRQPDTWKHSMGSKKGSNHNARGNIADDSLPPNLELAAIIVKNHVYDTPKKREIGGWGLKFLKKYENKPADVGRETSASAESCQRNSGECSTSIDILVTAGYHGGPKTQRGGPSSILERWTSGGLCDCGGWDVGCPLTVISTRPNWQENSLPLDHAGTVDLFIKGSKQRAAIVKMASIDGDLYCIHFHSTLSALQSFAIASAIIHNNTPALRPELYRN